MRAMLPLWQSQFERDVEHMYLRLGGAARSAPPGTTSLHEQPGFTWHGFASLEHMMEEHGGQAALRQGCTERHLCADLAGDDTV